MPRARAQRAPLPPPISHSSSVENTLRRPSWRRAIPSSWRSSSNGSMRTFESEPMQSGIPRCRTRTAGRNPSPRSASVVGQAQIVEPLSRSRSSSAPLACVAWMTVVRSPRHPQSREQLDRPQPVLGDAFLDLARLLVRVHVEGKALVARVARRAPRASRAGTRGRSGARPPTASPRPRSRSSSSRYAATDPWRMRGNAATRVRGVDADEGDPGLLRRLCRGEGRLGAEVVELAHRREPGGPHLAVRRARRAPAPKSRV